MVFHLYPQLADILQPSQFQLLLVLLTRLLPLIERQLHHRDNPLKLLSSTVTGFLAQALAVDRDHIARSWDILRPFRDRLGQDVNYQTLADDLLRLLGPRYGLGAETLYPPVTRCIRTQCLSSRGTLSEPISVQGTIYTHHRGALPVTATSLYCHNCNTRYYHNYYVHNASGSHPKRVYYRGVPEYIHVHSHAFVERALCSFFEIEMAISQVSAANIATVYNTATAPTASPVSPRLPTLTYEVVLDAFFLHALLQDKTREGRDNARLVLPHDGLQEHRFDAALRDRNRKIRHHGQEMWAHACSDCVKRLQRQDGSIAYISAGVTDGVTVGHPCCAVLNCQEPLEKGRDRYCPKHHTCMDVCAVETCDSPVTRGFVTCTDPAHRAWEAKRRRRQNSTKGAAFTILSERHDRATRLQNSEPEISITPGATNGAAGPSLLPDQASSNGDAPSSHLPPLNRRQRRALAKAQRVESFKGHIYRRWTHSEQLFVCCCGIIKSRATFFGAEGPLGVIEFLKGTFPPRYPGSLPCYIFYDNNCHILKTLRARKDHYFDNVGLPVDVFHALHKHKADDMFCQRHCNPAAFPDLMTDKGEWIFNSSIAEQVNRWFGGFQRLVREMAPARYHFYLDEVISIRNRVHAQKLQKAGKSPHIIPDIVLSTPIERAPL